MSDAPLVALSKIPPEQLQTLLKSFYADKDEKTLAAYKQSLRHLQLFAQEPDESALVNRLLGSGHMNANLLVTEFKNALVAQNYAPNTINLRLTAIRSLISFANTFGIVPWSLVVKSVRAAKYRDTRGPSRENVMLLLKAAGEHKNPAIAARNSAIIWLMFGRGLRRNEVRMMDITDCNLPRKAVAILRKKHSEKIVLTISDEIVDALRAWINVRGGDTGPLFSSMQTKKRLSAKGVWQIIVDTAVMANIGHVHPHMLRHSAINEAFEATDDLREVQQFSGHANIQTLMIYDDHRKDAGGDISQKISSGFKKKTE